MRTRWRPTWRDDGQVLKILQSNDETGEVLREIAMLLTEAVPEGDNVRVTSASPETLLMSMPLPYDPPGQRAASDPQGFEYHWRQLHYVFGLPDPSLFPALPAPLPDPDNGIVQRFIQTTRDLAACTVVNTTGGFSLRWPDGAEGDPVVEDLDLPARDHQAGFTAFLRQCLAPGDEITVSKIHSILWQASEAAADTDRDIRLEYLKAWSAMLKEAPPKVVVAARSRSLRRRGRLGGFRLPGAANARRAAGDLPIWRSPSLGREAPRLSTRGRG